MSDARRRILVVDDEQDICETMAMLLNEEGYDVLTANHGFDALVKLRGTTPDLIISDLNMPQMSGFEFLSVVRCRFPSIPVIAMSGAFASGECFPGGVLADGFYAKGRCRQEEILQLVDQLVYGTVTRSPNRHHLPATVQMSRHGRDSKGEPFNMLTCTECLRSFPLSGRQQGRHEIQEAHCPFCGISFCYISAPAPAVVPEQYFSARQTA